MASSVHEVTTKDEDITMGEPSGVSSPKELRNALYARCASFEEGHVFRQDELLAFGIIPSSSIEVLLTYTKQLAREGLLKLMIKEGRACWKVVKRAEAAKYRSLSQDEALVYSYIEGAAREGIWSKYLRTKVNLHMTTVNRAIKSLENKNLIKAVKMAKHPNRKTYMAAKYQPSEDVTGGVFFTDGDVDDEFINQMSRWTERYIIGKTWIFPPHGVYNPSSETTQEQAEYPPAPDKKMKGSKPTQKEAEEHPPAAGSKSKTGSKTTQKEAEEYPPAAGSKNKTGSKKPTQKEAEELRAAEFQKAAKLRKQDYGRDRTTDMIPRGGDGHDFPTLSTITKAINDFGLSDIKLKESEMEQLLYNLCMDGRIATVKNEGKYYQAVKVVHGENGAKLENGLTESPCGRCPVFDFCEEGGPVNAISCEYYQEWLEF